MIFLTLLLGTACQHDVRSPYAACVDLEYEGRKFCEVSFIELLGNPDVLNSMDVAVQGVVYIEPTTGLAYLGPPFEGLWFSTSDDPMYLNITSDIVSLNLAGRENEHVTVHGRFVWNPRVINSYRREMTDIALISGSPLRVP